MLPCYHGQLCSADAERILEGLSNSFLVRQSVVNMKTIISAVKSKGKVSHWLVPSSKQDISDQLEDIQRMVDANDFGHPVVCQEDSSEVSESPQVFPKLACPVCRETSPFQDWRKKGNHMNSHQLSLCEKCTKYIPLNSCSKHKEKCQNEASLCCDICDYKTVHKGDLKLHQQRHEKRNQKQKADSNADKVCPECGKMFSTKSNMIKHKKSHNYDKKIEEGEGGAVAGGAGGPAEALEGGGGVQDLEFVLPPQRNEEENVKLSSHHQFLVDVLSSIELITSANHNRGARSIVTQVLESCEGRLKKTISLGVVEEISSICASLYRYIRAMNWWLDDLTLPMT